MNRDGDSRAISFRPQQSANSRCKYFPADRGGAEKRTDGRTDGYVWIRLPRFAQPVIFPSLLHLFVSISRFFVRLSFLPAFHITTFASPSKNILEGEI